MPKALKSSDERDARKRARVDLTPEVSALLDEATVLFELPRAVLLRRLIEASLDVGPALSAENARSVLALAVQVRAVGRNLMQLLHAIHAGRAVLIEESEPVWRGLGEIVGAISEELNSMTISCGMRLRDAARLRAEALP